MGEKEADDPNKGHELRGGGGTRLYTCEEYPVDARDGDLWWPYNKPIRIKAGDRWRLALQLKGESDVESST